MRERTVVVKGYHFLIIGAFFSFLSLILQIAVHVSQSSPTVGRDLAMVTINLQALEVDMRKVFGNSSIQDDLYNTTAGAALGESLGLRHEYRWGLYHYCAYILEPSISGVCGNTTFSLAWTPFEVIRDDIPPKYFVQVNQFIINSLRDSPYLGTLSRVAYWLILVATVATICVIPLSACKTTLTFLLAAILSCGAAASLLIAASMWSSAVSHVQATNRTQTGIVADFGQSVWLIWAAFSMSLLSVLPYVVSEIAEFRLLTALIVVLFTDRVMREYKIKGQHCLGLGALFTFTALILLIFVHVGQVNPGKVPRSISMVYMDVSGIGAALQSATGDPAKTLYNVDNRSIGLNQGLQTAYSWGLYSVCGYAYNATYDGGGGCTNTSIAYAFTPFDVIANDTPPRYPVALFIANSPGVGAFTNSGYFTTLTHVAYYLILIATIATAVAFVVGIWRYTATFVISTLLVILAAIFLLISAILWSTVISQAKSINDVRTSQNIPVGITLQQGNAPYLIWAAFAFLVASIIPYGISCCTYRRY